MSQILRKFIKGLKEGGVEYIFRNISTRVPKWLFYYQHSLLFTATEPRLITRHYKDYTVRFGCIEDTDMVKEIGLDPPGYKRRLDRGDTLALVEKHGRTVCYNWVCTGRFYLENGGSVLDTGDDTFYLSGVFTLPEERMKGFINAVYDLQFAHYRTLGRPRAYGEIDAVNHNSLRVHQRMGFAVAGETYHVILLGIALCYYKSWPYPRRRFHLFFRRPADNLPIA